MASSGNGKPQVDREMDLSDEVPSPPQHDIPLEVSELECIEFEGNAGNVGGRVSMWVKGRLLPTAELLVLWLSTCATTTLAWGICHDQDTDSWFTLSVTALTAITTFGISRRYLAKRSALLTP